VANSANHYATLPTVVLSENLWILASCLLRPVHILEEISAVLVRKITGLKVLVIFIWSVSNCIIVYYLAIQLLEAAGVHNKITCHWSEGSLRGPKAMKRKYSFCHWCDLLHWNNSNLDKEVYIHKVKIFDKSQKWSVLNFFNVSAIPLSMNLKEKARKQLLFIRHVFTHCFLFYLQYRDSVEENSTFSLIRMRWLPSARACVS